MAQCSIAIQVLPQVEGQHQGEFLRVIDKVIANIVASGLHYVVGPFETTVEGDFDELMDLIKRSQEICIEEGAYSVSSYVKIVYAPQRKVYSIDEKIGKYQA